MAVHEAAGAPPRTSPLNDPRVRSWLYQAVLLALVAWLVYAAAANAVANLRAQNIASGFGFLNNTAGFSISQTLLPYSEASSYGRAFLVGLLNTLLVAGIGIVFATLLGFVVGIARLSGNWLVSKVAAVYVELTRNLPLLLQILFWYGAVLRSLPSPRQSIEMLPGVFVNNRGMFVPRPLFLEGVEAVLAALLAAVVAAVAVHVWARRRQERTGLQFPSGWTALGLVLGLPLLAMAATGFPIKFDLPQLRGFNFVGGSRIIPEFVALTLALVIYTAGFIAEIVRAGILAVSRGQTEAAYALGLRPGHTLRLVIIPQALRVIIPPLTSQYLNLTKNSSLAVAVGYPDLVAVFAGTVLNQTGQALEVIAITMAVYLTISLTTSALMNWYNRRVALVER
jgi:general L-amino acid transport system permease protein